MIADLLIATLAIVGLPLLAGGCLDREEPSPPPVRPLSERMGCPPPTPKARMAVVFIEEHEDGALESVRCIRVKGRERKG